MTYDKQNDAVLVAVGIGFNECVYTKQSIVVLVRVASGVAVSPTQRFGKVALTTSGGGAARREQTTVLDFDASGAQEPIVRWTGVCHNPYVENVTTGRHFLVRVDLVASEQLEVDMELRTVKRDGQMVWGYTGRWFEVKPGDVVSAGAEGIGAGFSAEVDLASVDGLITVGVSGAGILGAGAQGSHGLAVARQGAGVSDRVARAGRQGVGAGALVATGGGEAEKRLGY